MADSKAAGVQTRILALLPALKSGTLRIWGDWFGRPYDNHHRLVGAETDDAALILTFDEDECLSVWHPEGAEIDATVFRIQRASRVRWEWFYYGRPQLPQNRFFLEYTLEAGQV